MKNKVTILSDNRADKPFISEHGLSILLEIDNKRLLFDTGQGETLFQNADKLGIPLTDLDALVLSHGHYDHGGNVARILAMNPTIPFFAHPDCLISRYSFHPGKDPKSVALSQDDREAILNLPDKRLNWSRGVIEVIPGVWMTDPIPRKNNYEDTGGAFYKDIRGNNPDLLLDDLSIWIEGEQGITVICGCCHSGLQNTIEHIFSYSGTSQIHTLIGGLHLINAEDSRITKTISYINKIGIKRIIPAHCSGKEAVIRFQEELEGEVETGTVGLEIQL